MLSSLSAIMASLGAHIQDLLRCGYTRNQVAAMSRQGELIRARIGWFVSPTLEPEAIRAIRVGGRLGCASAARSHGLGVPLRAARIRVRSQVPIGRYRADFLVDEWLVIEADGAIHGTEQQFISDRERDSFFVGSGFPVLRFTYRQIVDQWPQTLGAISAALNQRVVHA